MKDWRLDDEDEEVRLEEQADRAAALADYIQPALNWLAKQPEGKKFVVRIQNLPR